MQTCFVFLRFFSRTLRVESPNALSLCLQNLGPYAQKLQIILKKNKEIHTKHPPKQTFVALSFIWGWEVYVSSRNNEDQWATQGHSLPRKLLWFPAQPLSALYLCLSLDSFEAAIKGPTKEFSDSTENGDTVESRSLIFISLFAFVSPFMLILLLSHHKIVGRSKSSSP